MAHAWETIEEARRLKGWPPPPRSPVTEGPRNGSIELLALLPRGGVRRTRPPPTTASQHRHPQGTVLEPLL